ncbi:MAG: DUF2975 domain-containing protein [Gammaproteobacteria bacterium]|nr:DUF2975 domain-containing protein [Gammaproteobacteria bacterium]
MAGEGKNIAPENKSESYNASVSNWINGLNLAGLILLLSSFILVFAKIGTPMLAMVYITLASGLFAASAFVKLFKTTDWINYCRANKKRSKIFDWLNLIAAASFVLLFLFSGGFGLFVNKLGVSTTLISAMTPHMAIGVISFFAVATVALLYSVIVRLTMVKEVASKEAVSKVTRANLEGKLEDVAKKTCDMLKQNLSDESLEQDFASIDSSRTPSNIFNDLKFESGDEAKDFFAKVTVYYIRHGYFPTVSIILNDREDDFVKQIAARAKEILETARDARKKVNASYINMLSCDAPQVAEVANLMIGGGANIPQPSVPASGDLYNQFSSLGEAKQFFATITLYYMQHRRFPENIVLHDDEKDYIKNVVIPKMTSVSVSVSSTPLPSIPISPREDDTNAIEHDTVSLMLSASSALMQSSSRSEGDESMASEESGDENAKDEKESKKQKKPQIRQRQPRSTSSMSADEAAIDENTGLLSGSKPHG